VTAADETNLMIQSLVETMVLKLIASDAALFFPLLRDVFPSFEPDTLPLKSLRDAVERQCAARGFVMSETWLGKIEQLYKILQVNHGVMLVGRSGTGKTAAWTALLHALADPEDVDSHAYVIDPKALTKGELYGVLDNTTRDWRDGVFTATLRRIVDNLKGDDQSKKHHWILFDGDVDPEWVENLNSLLDDNKLLTLPNGERLALPPNVRSLFEVQDLKYATLATVSRCGMVWFSEETMPVENYIAEMKHTMIHQPLSQESSGERYDGIDGRQDPEEVRAAGTRWPTTMTRPKMIRKPATSPELGSTSPTITKHAAATTSDSRVCSATAPGMLSKRRHSISSSTRLKETSFRSAALHHGERQQREGDAQLEDVLLFMFAAATYGRSLT
jgi:dynein heavy chain 1